jgi:DNA-binding GntR family transcriptional regulator
MTSRTFEREHGDRAGRTGDDLRPPASDDQIAERIFAAVMERRLRPGAKLSESALCEAFGVGRARIRPILVKLGERGVVTLHPNRGAFVSSPSPEEAREVFEARRMIERSVVENVARRISAKQVKMLRAHIADERLADAAGDRREAIRLSGLFHVKLAEVNGNPVITRIVEQLVARTSLIIALFASRMSLSCSDVDHIQLLDAISKGDGALAAQLMDSHLEHVGGELDIDGAPWAPSDLKLIFGV